MSSSLAPICLSRLANVWRRSCQRNSLILASFSARSNQLRGPRNGSPVLFGPKIRPVVRPLRLTFSSASIADPFWQSCDSSSFFVRGDRPGPHPMNQGMRPCSGSQVKASSVARGRLRLHSKSLRNLAWCFLTWASSSLKAFLQLVRTVVPVPVACSVPVGRDKFRVQEFSSVRGVFEKAPCN